MNKRMIFYILGKMMGVEGIVLLIPAFVSLLYQEKSGFSFLIVSAVLILIYFVLGRKEPKSKRIYSKEGFAIVGLAWLLWSAFGALPFVISGSIPHYIDAFFETVSGFTTTGDSSERNCVLEKFYALDRWNGSAGLCYDDHLSGR